MAANSNPSLQPGACDQDLNTRQTCFCSVGGKRCHHVACGVLFPVQGSISSLSRVEPIPSAVKAWRPKLWDPQGFLETFLSCAPGFSLFLHRQLLGPGPQTISSDPVISRDPGAVGGRLRQEGTCISPLYHLHHLALSCSSCFSFAFTKPSLTSPKGQRRRQGQQRWEPTCPWPTALWYIWGALLAAGRVLSGTRTAAGLELRIEEQGCLLTWVARGPQLWKAPRVYKR